MPPTMGSNPLLRRYRIILVLQAKGVDETIRTTRQHWRRVAKQPAARRAAEQRDDEEEQKEQGERDGLRLQVESEDKQSGSEADDDDEQSEAEEDDDF